MSERLHGIRTAEVEFHGLANGPNAVGRDETGKTVFAPFCAPGDTATIQIQQEKASFASGFATQWHQLGPHRIDPPCSFFRPQTPKNSCGGCHYQHLKLTFQRASKLQNVQSLLRRALKDYPEYANFEVEECIGVDGFNYRNKAEFRVEQGRLGFFAHETHHLVPIDDCLIQHPRNLEVLRAASELMGRYSRSGITKILSRVSNNDELFVALETPHASNVVRKFAEELRAKLPQLVGIIARIPKRKSELLWGRDYLTETVNGLQFHISGEGFWQVNQQTTPLMVECALEFLDLKPQEKALDLFCGAGLFALNMAKQGAIVTGIELSAKAIADAKVSAANNSLNARFFSGDVGQQLGRYKPEQFEAILLDPPRAGAKESIADLLRLSPSRIVYVSCDPATLARDVQMLAEKYQLRRAKCFDIFPQTSHIETIVLLEKRPS